MSNSKCLSKNSRKSRSVLQILNKENSRKLKFSNAEFCAAIKHQNTVKKLESKFSNAEFL